MKPALLKAVLSRRGLSTQGNAKELLKRLQDFESLDASSLRFSTSVAAADSSAATTTPSKEGKALELDTAHVDLVVIKEGAASSSV